MEDRLLSRPPARPTATRRSPDQANAASPLQPLASFGVATRAAGGRGGDGDGKSSGDFAEIVELPGHRWLMVVGDVEGKGILAAADAVRASMLLRRAGANGGMPHQMVTQLNGVPTAWGPDDRHRSCSVCVLTIWAFRYGFAGRVCNAGAPAPLVLGADGGLSSLGGPGIATGFFPGSAWTDWAFRIVPGDTLIMFTDGLTDARAGNRYFGDGHLESAARRVVARHPGDAPRIAEGLVEASCRFAGASSRGDDIAVAVLAVASPTAPAASEGRTGGARVPGDTAIAGSYPSW